MTQQEEYIKNLRLEERKLNSIIKGAAKRLENAPAGGIRISRNKNHLQFYYKHDTSDRVGKYISVKEQKMIRALIQKKYDKDLLMAARKQLKAIEHFLKNYDPEGIDTAYYKICPELRAGLAGAVIPNEVLSSIWQSEEYEPKEITPDVPKHFTKKGERVRSKSEVLIADALAEAGISYRYECPADFGVPPIHPDFTIFRKSDRKVIFWEHLGMMDDPAYRNDAFARIRLYEKNGCLIGDRLVITMETYRQPLNLPYVNSMIRHYLLDDTV